MVVAATGSSRCGTASLVQHVAAAAAATSGIVVRCREVEGAEGGGGATVGGKACGGAWTNGVHGMMGRSNICSVPLQRAAVVQKDGSAHR